MGAGLGYAIGEEKHSPLVGAALGLGGSIAGARLANKFLTSPKVRNKMSQKMQGKWNPRLATNVAYGGIPAVANSLGREE